MIDQSFRTEYSYGFDCTQVEYFDSDCEKARAHARRLSRKFQVTVYVVRAIRDNANCAFSDTGQIVYYLGRESYREGEFPTGKKGQSNAAL
jgi:hypothetical protein